MDWYDVLAGGVLGLLLAIIAPNRWLIWTWSPKTKWGKKRVREKANRWSL
jgi:membrane-associated phospholipid phosphatase